MAIKLTLNTEERYVTDTTVDLPYTAKWTVTPQKNVTYENITWKWTCTAPMSIIPEDNEDENANVWSLEELLSVAGGTFEIMRRWDNLTPGTTYSGTSSFKVDAEVSYTKITTTTKKDGDEIVTTVETEDKTELARTLTTAVYTRPSWFKWPRAVLQEGAFILSKYGITAKAWNKLREKVLAYQYWSKLEAMKALDLQRWNNITLASSGKVITAAAYNALGDALGGIKVDGKTSFTVTAGVTPIKPQVFLDLSDKLNDGLTEPEEDDEEEDDDDD